MAHQRIVVLSLLLLVVLTAGCVVAYETVPRHAPPPPPAAAPPAGPTVRIFYDSLDPYGDWIWSEPWGWVWVPQDVPVSWRPYWDGQWLWTDDGWYWASEEPWAWAVYHYGRWTWLPRHGWVWVPGGEWAPAWVAWRHGGGWVGWAPLPPNIGWRAGIGLEAHGADLDRVIRTEWWCFVDEARYVEPRVGRHAVPSARNHALVRSTRNVTRYVAEGNRIVNRSIEIERFERRPNRPIPRLRTAEVASPREAGWTGEGTREVRVFRKPLAEAPAGAVPRRVGRDRISRDDLEPEDRAPAPRISPAPSPGTQPSDTREGERRLVEGRTKPEAKRSEPASAEKPQPDRKAEENAEDGSAAKNSKRAKRQGRKANRGNDAD